MNDYMWDYCSYLVSGVVKRRLTTRPDSTNIMLDYKP